MLSLCLNVCRLFDIVQNFTCSSVSNIINTQIIFLYQPLLTVSFNKDFKKQYERVRCQRNFCFFKYYNYSDNGSLFIVRLNIINTFITRMEMEKKIVKKQELGCLSILSFANFNLRKPLIVE